MAITGHRVKETLDNYEDADIEEDVECAEIILNVARRKTASDDNKIESVNSNEPQPGTSGTGNCFDPLEVLIK